MHIIDISDPAYLAGVDSYDTPGKAQGVAIAGNHAYAADRDGG